MSSLFIRMGENNVNEHTQRILERLRVSCNRFLQHEFTNDALLGDVEALCGALEDKDVSLLVRNFIVDIEDSRHLFDDDDGRMYLERKIKQMFESVAHLG